MCLIPVPSSPVGPYSPFTPLVSCSVTTPYTGVLLEANGGSKEQGTLSADVSIWPPHPLSEEKQSTPPMLANGLVVGGRALSFVKKERLSRAKGRIFDFYHLRQNGSEGMCTRTLNKYLCLLEKQRKGCWKGTVCDCTLTLRPSTSTVQRWYSPTRFWCGYTFPGLSTFPIRPWKHRVSRTLHPPIYLSDEFGEDPSGRQ